MSQFENLSWVALGLDLLVKMTLLLLVAIVVDRMMSRQTAAARHWLWVASFVGLLLLPLAIWIAPGFRMDVWPAQWNPTAPFANLQIASVNAPVRSTPPTVASSQPIPSKRSLTEAGLIGDKHFTLPSWEHHQLESSAPTEGMIPAMVTSFLNRADVWLVSTWALGLAISLSPLWLGFMKNRSLRRASKTSKDPSLLNNLALTLHQLKIDRKVELRVLDAEIIPLTWGIIRPVILLPRAAETRWTPDRQQVVLLHELAHVKRLDVLWQVIARVTCSLYFFHPLVWYANRRLRIERELACDDCVLFNGIKSSSYAEQLLQLAREYQSSCLSPAAVAMAQRSGLHRRVHSVLNQTTSRQPLSRALAIGVLLTFASLAFLLAVPKLNSAAIAQDGKSKTQQSNQTTTKDQPDSQAELAADELVGIVVDEQGVPLADVLVDAWSWYPGNETKTDQAGRFRLKLGGDSPKVEIRFMKDGYSPFYKPQQAFGVRDFKVTLGQRTFIEGLVRDSNGKPVADVEVRGEQGMQQGDGVMIGSVSTSTKTNRDGRYKLFVHPDTYQLLVRSSTGQTARLTDIVVQKDEAKQQDIDLQQGVRFEAKVINSLNGEPFAGLVLWNWRDKDVLGKSDANGKLVIEGMLPGDFEFNVGEGESQKFGAFTGYLTRTIGRWWSPEAKFPHQREELTPSEFQRNLDSLNFDLEQGMKSVTIYVEPGVSFSGQVTDPDGKPVEGATVAPAKTGSGNSLTGDTRYSVKTDADGRYQVVMPAGKQFPYNLIAHDGDYQQWRTWANGVTDPLETQPGEKHEINIQLTRPAVVRGKVIADGGREVAGREVRAHAKDLRENRYYDPTVRTQADGSFELKFIRPGEHWIQVEPFYLSAGEAPAGSVEIRLAEGELRDDIELKLPAAAQPAMPAAAQRDFSIQLLDEKGKPIPNYDLILNGYAREANFAALIGDRGQLNKRWKSEPIGGDVRPTDAQGNLELKGSELFSEVAAPLSILALDPAGYRGAVGSIFPDAKIPEITLKMQPLREVRLEVDESEKSLRAMDNQLSSLLWRAIKRCCCNTHRKIDLLL